MADAYPLQWPIGRRRWDGPRESSRFRMTPSASEAHLFDQLDIMGAEDIVISSNKKPYSRSQAELLEDPGIAVYFKRKGQELAMACDKYARVSDNLHAVGLALEAFRTIERHGTGEMVDQAFTGFKALPETAIVTPYTDRAWHEVLQVASTADWEVEVIQAAYNRLLHRVHPDTGGSETAFIELQNAFKEAKRQHGRAS